MKKRRVLNYGAINGGLNLLSEKLINLLKNGMFGKLFTSNTYLEKKASEGIIVGSVSSLVSGTPLGFRRRNLRAVDQSLFYNAYKRLLQYFCSSRLNLFGTYFITFGFYSVLIYIIRSVFINNGDFSLDALLSEYFICSLFIMLSAIPLLNSKDTLSAAVSQSGMIRPLLENFGGVPENKFKYLEAQNKVGSYFAAVILGMLTGGLTYFVSPLKISLMMLVAVAFVLIMSFPELGVIFTIFLTPFLGFSDHPTIILSAVLGVTLLSYIAKLLIGKRAIKFRLIDGAVVLFALLFLMGGIVSAGDVASTQSAIIYFALLSIYFLTVNLMNTHQWLERCIYAIAIPSILISIYGIVNYAANKMPASWVDGIMFSNITNRAVSVFDNPNILATYLILTAPFVWVLVCRKGMSPKGRALAAAASISSLICIILTWSRGGWLGLILGAIVFCLINYKYTLKYLLIVLISSPIWYKLIPNDVMSRFLSIGNLSDSSTYYRLFTWKGALKLFKDHLLGGIGVGESAFVQMYPLYAYIGIEATVHCHNLFLEIAVELGVIALVVFLLIMFMTLQKGFETLKKTSNLQVNAFVSAAISGILAALAHGMVDYIWYNYRVFFMFWLVVGIVVAYSAVCAEEQLKNGVTFINRREKSVSLDIVFEN